MHAFGVDDTLQFLALFSCCLDVDQFKRAQVVWFWEVLKTRSELCGVNGVIPLAMKFVLSQVHSLNFLISHVPTGRVFSTVQTAASAITQKRP
jgi:hypothetical protein